MQGRMIILAVLAGAYVAAQMSADVMSLRILSIASMSIDGGTLIYPLTFTLRDLVHKVGGAASARAIIVSAAAANVIMALLFGVVAALPPDMSVGAQSEFGAVLAPVWGIVVASMIAEVVAEMVDTEIYRAWRARAGARHQWARVLLSNAISVPLDSVIFAWLAFGTALPANAVWGIVLTNVLVKGATTLVSLPSIYLVHVFDEP